MRISIFCVRVWLKIDWLPIRAWFLLVFKDNRVMDPKLNRVIDPVNALKYEDEIVYPSFVEPPNLLNGFQSMGNDLYHNFTSFSPPILDPAKFFSSSSTGSEVDSPDDNDSDPVLKYLNQILLEENVDARPSMFLDPLALQAAEKSLYDALGEKYPSSPYHQNQKADSPDSSLVNSSEYSPNSSITSSSTVDPHWVVDPGDNRQSVGQSYTGDYSSKPSHVDARFSSNPGSKIGDTNWQVDGFTFGDLAQNIFSDSDSMLQFRKGMEEASKFLPSGNQFIIDLDKYNLPPKSDQILPNPNIKLENDESKDGFSGSRGTKHLHRLESQLEEQRSSKQSAVYVEEVELSEMFDKVLLFKDANGNSTCNVQVPETDKIPERNGVRNGSTGGKNQNRSRNQGSESEAFDLRTLLINCAQSVAADDRRTAYEQLKQIRQHSSSKGDSSQRLASVFANGLEARLAGNLIRNEAASIRRQLSASEKLKAFQVFLSACPFKKISIFFANMMILQAASKATTLHIVDFGILYGFQWPILIQHLSNLPGGPPRLRITGIEQPQPGFRPAELIEQTGRRLAKYCERFHVPFEYQAIPSQNWETITIEDLKIVEGEVLAVNNIHRFKNLPDETIMVDNPRDAVLKLIKKMNPDIFVHSIENGAYNAPFFMTRFREALFYYSSLFDMLDATLPREDEHRLIFEQEFYGRYLMDIISCEGTERVERPETYKQWQVRLRRAGFMPLPLNKEIIDKLRGKVKACYHKDFDFDEDGSWMLQGWKGRIICASSCWVPALP